MVGMEMTAGGLEFDCIDCGRHVVSWFASSDARCCVCGWVVENIPIGERPAVRERLGVPLIASHMTETEAP